MLTSKPVSYTHLSQHDQTYRTNVENAIFEKLIEDSEVEVNDEDIQRAMEQHIQHIRMDLAKQGMQLEQYLDVYKRQDIGVTAMFSITNEIKTLNQALLDGQKYLQITSKNVFRLLNKL